MSSSPQQHQHQQHRKKKVEWSHTLSSSNEPQIPKEENKSPGWDTESDHLLSYFLSSNGGVSSPSTTQFVTTPPMGVPGSIHPFATSGGDSAAGGAASSSASVADMMGGTTTATAALPPATRPSTYGKRPPSSYRDHHDNNNHHVVGGVCGGPGGTNIGISESFSVERRHEEQQQPIDMDEKDDDDDGGIAPPPTPAIQHYFPSSSRNNNKNNSNDKSNQEEQQLLASHLSSSSFEVASSMAFPQQGLPPRQHAENPSPMQMQHAMNSMFSSNYGSANGLSQNIRPGGGSSGGSSVKMDEISPISPAGMICVNNHEPMVLPDTAPPPPSTNDVAAMTARQNHMEWLKQINALAQANAAAASSGVAIAPVAASAPAPLGVGDPYHSPPPMAATTMGLAPPGSLLPPGVPIHPAAAAAMAATNPIYFSHHAAAYLRQQASSSPVETEEKRAKRLERNRESARKSRRRKKERLTNLEGQVNGLNNRIDKERRLQINAMDQALGEVGKRRLEELFVQLAQEAADGDLDGFTLYPSVEALLNKMETPIRKDIVEFQYTVLGQYLLPRYQKFVMWLFLHDEDYFFKGKEEYVKREAANGAAAKTQGWKASQKPTKLASPGKISSKQIGDELTNGPKLENDGKPKKGKAKDADRPQPQAVAVDAAQMWPLTCFEMSISVDQEDKFLLARKRVRNYENFRHEGAQIAAATRMTARLKEAVLYQVYVASFRKRKTFLEILTPRQAILYQEWLLANGDRCKQQLMDDRMKISPVSSPAREENVTLEKMCQNLEEVLRISKQGP